MAVDVEYGREVAYSRAVYGLGFITIADLPDVRDHQRPADSIRPGLGCGGAATLTRTQM